MKPPVLAVRDLAKSFDGFMAVDGVDLEVRVGETVALIGPNGAGKTTFYNLISGRMRPTRGSIVFEGRDVTGLPPHRMSRLGLSRSFQINNIFEELTVRENVEVALTALHRKSWRLFASRDRDEALHREADGVLARLGLAELAPTRAGVLSYGDKRLLEIAIVLATRPQLVLLDEPTAGMTPDETRAVTRLIREIADSGDQTFVVTEHDMEVVFELADRIVVLHHGRVLAQGSADEIRANRAVREAYLGDEQEA
ncbi:ABC transporter ATP-binding protein [Ottowia sp.]|uniref:ABC transporter ATP-binding protein n=1 Tax=Ottowia sp. TaxID=1898956 RepID=UPI002B65BCE1|nr:ABC transporter ATP-binding protein [Ottowia sp.]HRN76975.1 ABC transporter ATP-binding protein [Ottowia sp.]HRQ04095.1 ABC transporter ATP-binding protein [Ottowia sp.]